MANPLLNLGDIAKDFSRDVQKGSVSSGSVPASSYGGKYSSYAPTTTTTTAPSSAPPAPTGPSAAQVQRRQVRQQQARQARREVAQSRKRRSGQDVARTKQVLKQKAKLTPKQAKATAPVIANALKRVAQQPKVKKDAYPFVPYEQRNTVAPSPPVAVLKARDAGKQATATVRSLSSPPRDKATRRATEGTRGLTKALQPQRVQAKKPRKVAKRLQRAVKRSTPEIEAPLSREQKTFATTLAKKTGMSPRLTAAAVLREGGNENPGDNNWLNIGAFDSGFDQGIMGDPRFADPVSAAKLTAKFFKGKEYGASEGIQNIYRVAQAGGSDQEVGEAWANSGWASSGASPLDTLDQVTVTGQGKDIPTKLKRTARQTLGKPATKALLEGGKVVRDPKAGKGTGPVKVDSAQEQVKVGAIEKTTPKEDKFFSYDHETDRAWFDPILKRQLIALAKESGEPIQLNSGFRTLDEQKAAYADYQAGGNLAAVPGSSNHEYGLAADVSLTETQRGLLSKYGLGLPVDGEDWHVEVVDPDLQAKQTAVNLGAGGSGTVEGGNTNIPVRGKSPLAVKPPPPPTTGGVPTASSGTSSFSGSIPSGGTSAPTGPSSSDKAQARARRNKRYRNYVPYADAAEGYYSINPDDYEGDPFLQRLAAMSS